MRGLDAEQYAEALDVPEDAGEFADGLRGILIRIPDGWGRWIGCERGWYPLLTELDGELAVVLPRYRIYQVKEKFAGLRFYWHSGERIVDPNDPEPAVVVEAASPVSAVSVATEPGTRRCASLARMLRATNLCLTMTTRTDRPVRRSGRSLFTMLEEAKLAPASPS